MRPPQLLIIIACSMFILLFAGCLELHQELVVEDDNTGSFAIRAALPSELYNTWLSAPTTEATAGWARFFDVDRGSALFNAQPSIDLQSYRVFEKDDQLHLQIRGELTDLKQALASGLLGKWSLNSGQDGQQVLSWRAGEHGHVQGTDAQLRSLTRDLRLTLKVTTPRTIVSTTAPSSSRRSATWRIDATSGLEHLRQPTAQSVTF